MNNNYSCYSSLPHAKENIVFKNNQDKINTLNSQSNYNFSTKAVTGFKNTEQIYKQQHNENIDRNIDHNKFQKSKYNQEKYALTELEKKQLETQYPIIQGKIQYPQEHINYAQYFQTYQEKFYDGYPFKPNPYNQSNYSQVRQFYNPFKKTRFTYLDPNTKLANYRRNHLRSKLVDLNKYDDIFCGEKKPNYLHQDDQSSNQFEEIGEFFKYLLDAMWTELEMENLRIDLGKQMDFSIPTLYRLKFNKFKDGVKREQFREGLNRCHVQVSEQEVKLIMKRFSIQDPEKLMYEEFQNIFTIKTQEHIYDHIFDEKQNKDLSQKTWVKIEKYFRQLAIQETQFETFRVEMEQKKFNFGKIYSVLTKNRDTDLSIDEFRYSFRRFAMQVTFDEFKMLFMRIDKVKKEYINRSQFIYTFTPHLKDEVLVELDRDFNVKDHVQQF